MIITSDDWDHSRKFPAFSTSKLSVVAQALFRVFYILAILLASWYYFLQPVQASAQNAYEALCGHVARRWTVYGDAATLGKLVEWKLYGRLMEGLWKIYIYIYI